MAGILLIVLGGLLLLLMLRVWRRTRGLSKRRWRALHWIGSGSLLLAAMVALLAGGTLYWYYHRPLPSEIQATLFQGITYTREVRDDPRPLVIHVVTIDLNAPGIEFLVTPGEPTEGRQLCSRKTSGFLEEFDLQVAINGDFFTPWWTNSPWDYYPHVGDPVDVFGFASSEGEIYSQGREESSRTLYISRDNRASFSTPPDEVYNAISGNTFVVLEGEIQHSLFTNEYQKVPNPRTAVALDQDADTLILIVVDGRQPNYSEGVGLAELGKIALDYGAYTALNMDGGGSSTLMIEDNSGDPDILNSPIDNRIPGRERPVANHLGVRALRMK